MNTCGSSLRCRPRPGSAFENNEKYATLIATLSDDIRSMLQRTRGLFVEYILDAMLEQRAAGEDGEDGDEVGALTVSVLRAAKQRVLAEKFKFTSKEGLFSQLALLNPSLLSRTEDARKKEVLPHQQDQKAEFCVRHHFGVLQCQGR